MRIVLDPIELAAESKRGRERDRPGPAVTEPERRDRRDDGAARRSQVGQRRREVAAEDCVYVIGPSEGRHRERRISSEPWRPCLWPPLPLMGMCVRCAGYRRLRGRQEQRLTETRLLRSS